MKYNLCDAVAHAALIFAACGIVGCASTRDFEMSRAEAETPDAFWWSASPIVSAFFPAATHPHQSSPAPRRHMEASGLGHLRVYSSTRAIAKADASMAYPSSAYRIYDRRGHLVRNVRNIDRSGSNELPDLIELPPGSYTIQAESDTSGALAVPAIIKPGLTTVVNLEAAPERLPKFGTPQGRCTPKLNDAGSGRASIHAVTV